MTYPLLADPLEKGWTALQSWDPERGVGALLAFRQQDERAVDRDHAPERAGRPRSSCSAAPTRSPSASSTSHELRDGLTVELAEKDTAEVLLIRGVRR